MILCRSIDSRAIQFTANSIILLFFLFCSACNNQVGYGGNLQQKPVKEYSYNITRDVVYTPADWAEELSADLYRPETDAYRPAVIVVHGGGWKGRSRQDMRSISRRLAGDGFIVLNISYRFAPEYRFPAQLHDLQQALRWLHENSERLCIDTSRIGGYGFSSGGHLVALLATMDAGEVSSSHAIQGMRLHAAVAGSAPTDLRKFNGGKLIPQFLGTSLEDNPEILVRASPVTHVSADDPPMFFYHGSLDALVDVSHAKDMHALLQEAGVHSELFIVQGLGHVTLFVLSNAAVEAALGFLRRQLLEDGGSHRQIRK